jgi:hypothetical protein
MLIGGVMSMRTQDTPMKTLKIRDRIGALRRTYPQIDRRTRLLYSGKINRRQRHDRVAVHIVAWSADGRVTLHRSEFHKPGMTITEWAHWLGDHAPGIISNQIRAYMNRTFGSTWYIEQIFGWHPVKEEMED